MMFCRLDQIYKQEGSGPAKDRNIAVQWQSLANIKGFSNLGNELDTISSISK